MQLKGYFYLPTIEEVFKNENSSLVILGYHCLDFKLFLIRVSPHGELRTKPYNNYSWYATVVKSDLRENTCCHLECRSIFMEAEFISATKLLSVVNHWRIQGGAPGTRAPPPGGPNSFIFMQFSAKN